MNNNIILQADGYKISHAEQYPLHTEYVYSYLESRGGKFSKTLFYGLQYYLKKYLEGEVVSVEKIDKAEKLLKSYLGNSIDWTAWRKRWEYIIDTYDGKLPIEIRAVAEGSVVETHNVLMTVVNTDPNCYWLTNYLETLLSEIWYPITVATQSREIKEVILKFLQETGSKDPNSDILFKLHCFGYRGVSSQESAALGSSAHLVNFLGTDTVNALELIQEYYKGYNVGFSIPASEHSTITSWGKENEVKAFENMLDKYPTGLVACVSDSFNIFDACEHLWGEQLKDKIMNRDGTLVVRPDSGDPKAVVLQIINILGDKFGYSTNEKGFKVLDPHVRIIQGDGVCYESIIEILQTLKDNGWAAENIGFGSGGALIQKLDRDSQRFAFKCSAICVDGQWQDVWKDPITDPGKTSKRGHLILYKAENGKYHTLSIEEDKERPDNDRFEYRRNQLVPVFRNGEVLKKYTFSEIRENAKLS
jgi:nicotinamide phosphoribosyltransferase